MSKLSWLIYFASVSQNASSFCIFLTVVFGILTAGFTIAFFMIKAVSNSNDHPLYDVERAKKMLPTVKTAMVSVWLAFFLSAFLAIALPDKNTIYLMSASEAGETVVTNPQTR